MYGLRDCMAGELLEFDDGSFGMAQNLENETVSVAVLSDKNEIREGTTVRRTGRVVSVQIGEALLGRVVDALGPPIDGKGKIYCSEEYPVEAEAPGIIERKSVSAVSYTHLDVYKRQLLTHAHFDHIMALEEVRAETGAPVFVHEADSDFLTDNDLNCMSVFSSENLKINPADRLIRDCLLYTSRCV